MKPEEAIKIFEKERDWGQWDPYLLGEFVKIVRNGAKV